MFRLWNKIIPLLLCAILADSCGFADLRPIIYKIEPDNNDSLLKGEYSPVILKFDTQMNRNDAEGIMQVVSETGVIKGDYSWKGNNLHFVPVPGWTAGVRYTLSLSGTIRAVDGRDLRLERFVSFYAVNKNKNPQLERHIPENGASIRTGDTNFEFYFSRPMDRLSVENALTIEGIGNKTFNWQEDGTVLIVSTDKNFTPWVSYRWSLKDSAKAADGVPLPKTYSGYFTTDLDQLLPEITGVYPVLNKDGVWYLTGKNIETDLAPGQSIAVSFNKPMGENVLRSLRFEPSLSGRAEFLDEKTVVYIFSKDPDPHTTYTLIVSSDTRDSEGLKTGSEYRLNFTPDIPYLNILSLTVYENLSGESFSREFFSVPAGVVPVRIDPVIGEFSFSIRFSLPFSTEEKLIAVQRITLSPFFPKTLPSAGLQYASWFSDDRLYMRWEGLKSGNEETPHFYTLTIPGDRGGISNGTASFLKKDITIFLEAK
jgi:hypothetical protein